MIDALFERFRESRDKSKRLKAFNVTQQVELLEDLILAINAKQKPLDAMQNATEFCNKKNRPVYEDIYSHLRRGAPLSEAIADWFDPMIVLSIKSGEDSRRLVQGLENAKVSLESQSSIKGKVIKANLYPAVLVTVGLIMNLVVAQYVIAPMLVGKSIESMPEITRVSYGIGMFVWDYWWLILIGIRIAIWVFDLVLNNWVSEVRFRLDNQLFFKQYRLLMAASFLRSMAIMRKSKVTVRDALVAVQNNSTPYLCDHASEMLEGMSGTASGLGQVMDTGLLNDQEISRVKAITSVSNDGVDELLIMVAVRHEKALDKSLKVIGNALNSLGLLTVALLILVAFGGQMAVQLADAGVTF